MPALPRQTSDFGYTGLRMTADEYLALGETRERYELIDGVIVMSPSPTPKHSEVAVEITFQLKAFARRERSVRVFADVDVRMSSSVVYQPDLAVYRLSRLRGQVDRLAVAPDLVIEVLSPSSKSLDLVTKREDYERFGVGEYWVVEPEAASVRWFARKSDRLVETAVAGDRIASAAIPGFELELLPLRRIAAGEQA